MRPFSIILPVLNEVNIINPMMDHLETLEGRDRCECIVVDGSAEGDTIAVIARRDICCIKSMPGRAQQMNAGAAVAKGEILIFLHVDTRLPRNALNLIHRVMTEKSLVGGAFDLRIDSKRLVLKIIARVASLRSRLTRVPYGDQAIFVRRDYFDQLGRYPEIPLMEDVAFMRNIKLANGKIGFIREPVITSARRWEREGVLYTTLRNWLLLGTYLLGAAPEKLMKYYKSG